jgi:hypothetical protein
MSRYDSHQGSVGRAQGASVLFIKSDGYFDVGDVAGGADGTQILGSQLQLQLLSPVTRTSFTMASAIQTVSVIPVGYGTVEIWYPSATTSVKLPAANVGATLIIKFGTGAVASLVSILAATSASIAVGYSDCSMINASINGASGLWLELVCVTANEWQTNRSNSWGVAYNPQRSS